MAKEKTIIILDRCIEFLLYAMIFFIPISTAAIEITFSLAMTVFFIKKIIKPDFRFLNNTIHFFLFLFFGFCVLSLFNSGIYLSKSITALFFKWLESILIFILVEDTLNTPKRLRNTIFIFLASSLLISLDAIFQQIRGIDFLRQRALVDGRPTASFHNQNSLASYLAPLTMLVTVLSIFEQKKRYRYSLFFLAVFLGIVLILTFSRGAWLGFIAGLVLLLFLLRNVKRVIIYLCIFIVIIMLIPASKHRAMSIFLPGGDADRFSLIFTSWKMIKDNPFLGKGLGTYMDYFSKYTTISGSYYAHNCYLQIWAETGIFSLLSFLAFIGTILYKGISRLRKNSDFLLAGFICVLAVFLVHIFFDTQLYSLQLSTLFWFMLGLLAVKINTSD